MTTYTKRLMPILAFCLLLSLIMASPAQAGSGATHPVTGALVAKYLTNPPDGTPRSKLITYAGAFGLGVLSHLVLDHAYHYEPQPGSSEMTYYTVEGAVGVLLLIPQWYRHPRLFFGSLGAMAPDLEHVLGVNRHFPVHSGPVPELNPKNSTAGIALNFALNAACLWAIYFGPDTRADIRQPISIVMCIGHWDTKAAEPEKGFEASIEGGGPGLIYTLGFSYKLPWLGLSVEPTFSSWWQELEQDNGSDYPPKQVITPVVVSLGRSVALGSKLHLVPLAGLGAYIINRSTPVDQGGVSAGHFVDAGLGGNAGLAVESRLSASWWLRIHALYHWAQAKDESGRNVDMDGLAVSLGARFDLTAGKFAPHG